MNWSHPVLSMAIVLLAGIAGGEVFAKLKLPKVTGWIATGIALRSLGLPGLAPADLGRYSPFTEFVLGYIAFTVGAALHLPSLRNSGKRLSLLVLTEATITPAVVVFSLVYIGAVPVGLALVLATIAIAGAPGTTMVVVQEARARGLFVKTLVAAVALIDMVAVGAFAGTEAYLKNRGSGVLLSSVTDALLAVGYEFLVAGAIAVCCVLFALAMLRTLVGPAFMGPLMIALIMGAWGLGKALHVSSILATTFAGVALSNIRHTTVRAAEAYLHPLGNVLFAGFFTFAGMRLNFSYVVPAAGLVAIFFAARLAGKTLSAFTSMSIAQMTPSVRRYLGIALLPHGGVAVGLVLLVQDNPSMASMHETVAAVGLAALAINQLVGPSATRLALQRVGEAGQDRPRLLEFLGEQRIVHDLDAANKSEAINILAARLFDTSDLAITKEDFVKSVLAREDEGSTCLGNGLMIPHAYVPNGHGPVGVLGISRRGLDFGASDSRKVHAVLLLATPESSRQQHLEILAAFVSAITQNDNLREQLYHARSAAHAYQIIHSDDADFNYFLEDAMAPTTRKPSGVATS